jgi:hypothetical protein
LDDEGGTVVATPAVMNAILDALSPIAASDLPMPATPEHVGTQSGRRRNQSHNDGTISSVTCAI